MSVIPPNHITENFEIFLKNQKFLIQFFKKKDDVNIFISDGDIEILKIC